MIFIRFGSHRAREYGLRAIDREPQAYFAVRRNTGPGGVYLVSEAEISAMRAYSRLVRFTRLRGPFTDLLECWS